MFLCAGTKLKCDCFEHSSEHLPLVTVVLFLLCVCAASAEGTKFQLIIHTVLLPKLIENTDKMNYCVSVQSNQRNTQVRLLPEIQSIRTAAMPDKTHLL